MTRRIGLALGASALVALPLTGSAAHAAPTTQGKVSRVQIGMTKQHVHEVLGARARSLGPAWKTNFGEQDIKLYRMKGGDFARVRYLKPKGSHHFYVVQAGVCDTTWKCTTVTPNP